MIRQQLWLVVKLFKDKTWELRGVFTSREKAEGKRLSHTKDRVGFVYIGPIFLDEMISDPGLELLGYEVDA